MRYDNNLPEIFKTGDLVEYITDWDGFDGFAIVLGYEMNWGAKMTSLYILNYGKYDIYHQTRLKKAVIE